MVINIHDMVQQCTPQVNTNTMVLLVQHESSGNPYAIGVNGSYTLARQPKTRDEAIKKARWLYKHGYDFDAGLAQINIKNAKRMGLSIEDLFTPCANLQAGAQILSHCYARASKKYSNEQEALHAALSCYNTGNFKTGFDNGYVKNLIRKAPKDSDDNDALADNSDIGIVPALTSQKKAKPKGKQASAATSNKKKSSTKG